MRLSGCGWRYFNAPAPCGGAPECAVTGGQLVGRAASSRDRKAFSWALAVMSGRAWVEDAPQVLHLHRVRPADVVPF